MEYGITDKLVPVDTTNIKRIFGAFPKNSAVAMKESDFVYFSEQCMIEESNVHVLTEDLMPGYWIYYFPQRSPFKEKIDEIIYKTIEYGLTKLNDHSAFCNKTQQHRKDSPTPLTLDHYREIFKLFLVSHCIATIVFVCEICIRNFNSKVI